jgi:hypothetical protein
MELLRTTMPLLAYALTQFMDRPVIDTTGLKDILKAFTPYFQQHEATAVPERQLWLLKSSCSRHEYISETFPDGPG